jgi:hypothetical protein
VLAVSQTLETHGYSDAAHTPGLIADLFRWADGRANQLAAGHSATVADKPKAKRGKAKAVEVPDDTTESNDSDDEEPF